MKIYTKGGDQGETSLWGQAGEKRIRKDRTRVEAYGTIDEANAVLGLCRTVARDPELADVLQNVQHRLFGLGSDLATLNEARRIHVTDEDVTELEAIIDRLEGQLPPLRNFILPGGGELASRLHQARTVVRRAERRVVSLYQDEPGPPVHLRYLNRLSDLLFVMARASNQREGVVEVQARFRRS
ncbi:MAG: cob(I)yrinic acid a,c-diamide adenosyltransferase [Firmicutes bacterium]|nr:cob(I)yrinic acid a,c-diamide adenosyltransferase [Bacillota bacterium]